jgi:hypothetical protein
MSNLSRLTQAGLIVANAAFNEADHAIIDSLSDQEVSALISISQKIPASFLQQHAGATAVAGAQGDAKATQIAPASRTIGIVF